MPQPGAGRNHGAMTQIEATLPAFFDRIAAQYGDAVAIEDAGREISYAALRHEIRRCARALIASGVAEGDRVLLWAPNRAEWLIAAFAMAHIGAVLVPTNTRFKGGELEELAERTEARLIFSIGHFVGQDYPAQLLPQTRARAREIVVIGAHGGGDTRWEDFLARAEEVPEAALEARIARITPETICDIIFTSGTTGRSKGVLYAQGQFLRSVAVWADRVGLRRGDRVLGIPPFFHSFGYRAAALGSLIAGARLLPHASFDAEEVAGRIARDRISVLPGPPTIFTSLMGLPGARDFASLRLGITGASTIPAALIARMQGELGLSGVCNGYGLSEAGGFGAITRAEDPIEITAQTSGQVMDGMELSIRADGKPLPQGSHGEICLRGYGVMQGYMGDPAATAEAIDPEGWLHTGDLGWLDPQGNLRIEDRVKDMFISGGFNCYPAEIERLLTDHPAIEVAAVIGIPDARMGEVGKAFVILRDGAQAGAEEIRDWARAHMANYKVPREIEIRADLPLSPSGKVLKRALSA